MKSRFILPLVAFGVLSLFAASSAQAGLFGHGCCGAGDCCGSPVVWSAPSCCDPCGRPGLFARLHAHLAAKRACCGASACCEAPSCGCEATCGAAEPACGAPAACDSCAAEPTCGAEPSCGCDSGCDSCCKPRCGLLSRLHAKLAAHRARRACCSAPVEVSCGCAAAEASCGCH
ncbi:MAG: hypothetical protein U0795_22925 [Pirellulales bacterium]